MKHLTATPAIALLALVGTADCVRGQESVDLDLAKVVAERPVRAGDVKITLKNRIPDVEYVVKITRGFVEIPELELPAHTGAFSGLAANDCPTGETLEDELEPAKTEEEVALAIKKIEQRQSELNCPADDIASVAAIVVQKTEWDIGTESLNKGEFLTIDVTRIPNKGVKSRSWSFVLSTGSPGEWRVQYGFTFLTFWINKDEEYFSKENPDTAQGGFIITPKNNTTRLVLAPSILFTWLPGSAQHKAVVFSLTGGLGYNFEDFMLFGGGALTFWQNLTFTAGMAISQVGRLNGQFEKGQVVQENLGDDVLTVRRFRPNVYFGLAFRFSTNPFEKQKKEPEKKPEAGGEGDDKSAGEEKKPEDGKPTEGDGEEKRRGANGEAGKNPEKKQGEEDDSSGG